MAELKQLQQKRTTIKSQLTRIKNAFADNAEVSEAKVKFAKIEDLWKTFEEVQDAIDAIKIQAAEGEEAQKAVEDESNAQRTTFEEIYFAAAIKAQTVIDVALNRSQAQIVMQARDNQNQNNGSNEPIQKFQYLRSSLSGEALQVIEGLSTTAANYGSVWELLQKNYENKKFLINTHLNQLLFPAITKDKSLSMRQLIVHVRTHLKALKTLELPVDHWDELLIHLLKNKMDFNTQKDWEEKTSDGDKRPTLEEYLTFLDERGRTLEIIDKGKYKQDIAKPPVGRKNERRVSLTSVSQFSCTMCNESHSIFKCPQFLQLPVSDRIKEVKFKKLCTNCLGKGHFAAGCKSSNFKHCDKKHNTLLHLNLENKSTMEENSNSDSSSKKSVVTYCAKDDVQQNKDIVVSKASFTKKLISHVVLSTARVEIEDVNGNRHTCRVLLDPGSQSNIITEELVRKLKLRCKKQNELISGINKTQTNTARTMTVKIRSMHAAFEAVIECLVLPSITERLPQTQFNSQRAFQGCKIRCWIVGGELIDASQKNQRFCGFVTNAALQEQLDRFFNQEEPREKRQMTHEEKECEQQFSDTKRRDNTGRFIVALPKRQEVLLGESEKQAARRLFSLERRFRTNPEVKTEYVKFMKDYQNEEHMSLIPDDARLKPNDSFVLPHQPVIKPDSLTTKLRVVFDASAKTSLGTALNDKLMVGPNLQNDLFNIILRFRAHEFVITADIAAMFRQIIVREEDRDLQRILWRTNETQPIQMYRLNTVTYGTAPAPYLAMRCLRQLAVEETEFPRAARVLQEDFYMDDVITGEKTIEKTVALQQELEELLQRGQFQLRKWRANDQRILENISKEREAEGLLIIDKEGPLKTLGLLWDSNTDTMQYSVKIDETSRITKRNVLSKIAQIFDPLGLLGPVIINAKRIMQKMWQSKTGWDELLPPEIKNAWKELYSSLPKINNVHIKRNLNPQNVREVFDLVGFGDASEVAYGACLYAVSEDLKGNKQSYLIASKSRVAPLKTISLPRLELNAALLLVKLCEKARQAYGDKISKVFLWSDSTIVLSWISTSPNIRKTYVANRITKIQELSQNAIWLHVPSQENPADLLSRGITVDQWSKSDLWWHGPQWLQSEEWPKRIQIETNMTEVKSSVVLINTENEKFEVLRKFSSFIKLQRVIAFVIRFKANALGKKKNGPLSVDELEHAERVIIRLTQQEAFATELQFIQQGAQVIKTSNIASFNPYIDSEGLLRVGGRLSRANIPENQKHPIILPSRHYITTLILKKEHIRLHHCGPESLLCSIRLQYWPLSGRREARKITKGCLQCFRNRPKTPEVMMADLPSARVQGSLRPFSITGIDYAGPLQVRESRRRGRVYTSKSWIAVFTCFATKAIHLELVTELTSESFLAALRRFVARRGMCSQIISDNGTNFVGAARELKEAFDFLKEKENTISEYLSQRKITWKFIPPRAPHFGGLWEAAVKATKRHLNTVTKGLVSTFEEYYTLLVEIESILNSRPLTPLSSDPNDLAALTPAHFLIGDTLVLPVEQNYLDTSDNRLSRWQHLQKVRQHFWKRWHEEYLQQLQRRSKWWTKGENIKIGALVLLKEDHVPPLQWNLGRVMDVHPGTDNIVRVVTVKTATGICKRAVKKLCPLPMESD